MKSMFFLFCFIPALIFAQTDSIVNYTDINGMKQGYWIKKDANGQKIYEGYFKNNIPYGIMRRFHGNGVVKAIMEFDKNDQKKVKVTYFDDTGELSAKGFFYDKKRDSTWQYFGQSAMLVGEEHYVKGKKHGVSKKYYPSGKIVEEIWYKNGKLDGPWIRYYENGNMRMKTQQINDKRIGDFYSYFADGKVEIKGFYENDLKDGIWKKFDDKGKVIKEMKFTEGKLENEEAIDKEFTKELEDAEKIITPKTKLVSFTYVSNALGTINPVKELTEIAHKNGAKVLVDAAQAIQHFQIDVQALDCDFLVFSGHKIYGPTGTGILYGKEDILNAMPPFEGGGDMIKTVSFKGTEFNDLPFKFEAGTPHIAGCIALGTAIEYIQKIGLENIQQYEAALLDYATEQLSQIEGLKIYGTAKNKSAVLSFLLDGIHPYDVGVILDNQGIAIRTGHHCAQPIMEHYNITGTCRATFAFYNTKEEIDLLKEGILKAKKMLS